MEISPEIITRHYQAADYFLLDSWWALHNAEPMHRTMIPASSVVVCFDREPVAFGAVFLCNSNHVAFFHGMVTRPGLSMRAARLALQALQEGIDIIMRSGGHTLLLGTVASKALVRGAKLMGFDPAGGMVQPVQRLVKPLTTQNYGT